MCCSWDLLTRKHFHLYLNIYLVIHSFKNTGCATFLLQLSEHKRYFTLYVLIYHFKSRINIVFEHLFISTNSLLGNFESMHCSKTSFDTPTWLYKHTFIWFWFKCIKEYLANFKDSFYLAIFIYLFVIY